jgi:hypothetical protein
MSPLLVQLTLDVPLAVVEPVIQMVMPILEDFHTWFVKLCIVLQTLGWSVLQEKNILVVISASLVHVQHILRSTGLV